MSKVKVHEKYLVVIPKEVREELSIKVGDEVEFAVEEGKAIMHPRRGDVEAIRRTHGIVEWKGSIDEAIDRGFKEMGKERRKS